MDADERRERREQLLGRVEAAKCQRLHRGVDAVWCKLEIVRSEHVGAIRAVNDAMHDCALEVQLACLLEE